MTNPATYPADATPVIRIRLINGPRDVVVYFKGWTLMGDTVRPITTRDIHEAYWYGDAPHECMADIKRLQHATGAIVLWSDVETEIQREANLPTQCPTCGMKLTPSNAVCGVGVECDECRSTATEYLIQNNAIEVID